MQAALLESAVIGLHFGFDPRQFGVMALQYLVVAAVALEMDALLPNEGVDIGLQRRVLHLFQAFRHGLDQEGFEIGHGERGAVDHVAPFGPLGMPDRIDALVESKGDAAHDNLGMGAHTRLPAWR